MRAKIGLAVLTVALLGIIVAQEAQPLTSGLTVKIKMTKGTYQVGEAVEGTVTIRSPYPAAVIATFDIQLIKDGQVRYTTATEIPALVAGNNRFSFKELGIPTVGRDPSEAGQWRITLIQQNVDGVEPALAEFEIIPADSP